MNQLDAAKNGPITKKIAATAESEGVAADLIKDGIASGTVVIPSNAGRNIKRYCAIGKGLSTKVNANIGSSPGLDDIQLELKKLKVAIDAGADTVMDLSISRNLEKIRHAVLENSEVPVGTVPVYQMAAEKMGAGYDISEITVKDMLSCIEKQAKEGVDFFTIHCGVTREALATLDDHKRVLDVVSRGGAIIAQWIEKNRMENPFYQYFDDIVDIARAYDVTLSLGDGLRPGSILDSTDMAQVTELLTLGRLSKRARQKGVQVIIEGPGHIPIHEIRQNVELEKALCDNAPFYVLGPLVTDIAPGYDHITGAIGGAIAAAAGADFLCYVTSSEHLRLPTVEDVREGVIASKIAAHAGDIAKGVKNACERDRAISMARKKRDWAGQIKIAIDPTKAEEYRKSSMPSVDDACTMCDRYCSIKLFEESREKKR